MKRMKLWLGVAAMVAGGLGSSALAQGGDFNPITCNQIYLIAPIPPTSPILCADGFIGPFGSGPVGSYSVTAADIFGGVLRAGFNAPGDLNPGGSVPGEFTAFNSNVRADASNPSQFDIQAGAGVSIPVDATSPMQGGAGNRSVVPIEIVALSLTSTAPVDFGINGLLEGILSHQTTGPGQVSMSARVIVRLEGQTAPIFDQNWFAISSNTSQFEEGFGPGEFAFNPGGGTGNAPFNDVLTVPNGSTVQLEVGIFADGSGAGDTSAWSSTLSVSLTPSSANPDATFSIVPEPASLALFMVGMVLVSRRRRLV